jgi:hypothetical protein
MTTQPTQPNALEMVPIGVVRGGRVSDLEFRQSPNEASGAAHTHITGDRGQGWRHGKALVGQPGEDLSSRGTSGQRQPY